MESILKYQPEELEELVTEYKNYQRIEEEAKAQKELLAAEIKTALGGYGPRIVGPYKITWSVCSKAGIDTKRLRAEYPAIAKLLATSSTYDKLTVN